MTTETKTETISESTEVNSNENTAASNKAVFGPLGKYAIVAVIMVSIIVTTAIMLNKQMKTPEEQIAVIENEVAEFSLADAEVSEAEIVAAITEVEPAAEVPQTVTLNTSTVVGDNETLEKTVISSIETTQAISSPSADVLIATETTAETTTTDSAVTESATATKNTTIEENVLDRHAQLVMKNQARIEAFKLEQKQHMSKMFARIKTYDAKQLEQYKSHQDTQVERLREQITKQQQMIDALVSRNKELYELRAANVQKNQTRREEMLNRI